MKRNRLINVGLILLILLLSVPVVLPYFHSGYFPTHDGQWAVVRLADMFRTLRDFQFPPRFSGALNFGYGYPLFNFAYPFPYYLGMILYFPLHSFIGSIKSVFVISVFLSALFMYLASNQLWKNKTAAFVSSILYIYLPYRMVDLYVRGSVGESLSFALFPLIFYLSLKLFDSPFSRINVFLLSISLGTLVMTHNIMTVLFIPLLMSFIVVRVINERRYDVIQSFLLCMGIGAGLSFFFWFPALFEKGNIALSIIPIADRNIYFVKLPQLIIPSWGFQPPTDSGGFSYQLGIAQLTVMVFSFAILLMSFFKTRFTQTPVKFYSMVLAIIYGIYFLFMFSFTGFIWKILPLMSEINYPWTILSQLGFISALLGGFLVLQGKYLRYFAILLAGLSIILTVGYAKPESYNNFADQYYLTNEATTTSSSELMPLWVKQKPSERYKEKIEIISGNAQITDLKFNSKSLQFKYRSDSDPIFQINTVYYPGWKAYINGVEVKINYDNPQGVIRIEGSKHADSVFLYFQETLPRTIADIVSVLAIILLFFILLRPLLLFKS